MFRLPRLTCCTCTWSAGFVPGELSFATKDGTDVPVGVNYDYTVCIQCQYTVHDGICYALDIHSFPILARSQGRRMTNFI